MNDKKNPFLVTGATGFLGKQVVKELIQRGQEVYVMTRDAKKAETIFKNLPIKIISASLMDPSSLQNIPKQSHIIHCAAITGSIRTTSKAYQAVNVEGTRHLLNVAIQKKVTHFTLVSSISAVGAVGSLKNPITEMTLPVPKTFYGMSKLEMEQMVLNLMPSEIPLTIIRPSLLYGPGQSSTSGAAALFAFCKGAIVPVLGNAKTFISLGFVNNVAMGLIDLSEHRGREIFNLSDLQPYTLQDLARAIHKDAKKQIRFVKIPYAMAFALGFCADRVAWLLKKDLSVCSENIKHLACNAFLMSIDKALKSGYRPMINLSQGVELTHSSEV